MSQERRPSLGFWATAVIVGLSLLYVLSFGPACGLADRGKLPVFETANVYRPLIRTATSRYWPAAVPLRYYGQLFASDDSDRSLRVSLGCSENDAVEFLDRMLNLEMKYRQKRQRERIP